MTPFTQTYHYDPLSGFLDWTEDAGDGFQPVRFRLAYDAAGRLESRWSNGDAMTSKVAVAHKYDAEGRLFERSVLSRDPSSGNMEYVYLDQISHDARGKVRSVSIQSDISSISQDFWINAYDGNGALAGIARSRGGGITADVFITDALGNTLARIGNVGTTPDTIDHRYAGDQLLSMNRHAHDLVLDGGPVDSTRHDKEVFYDPNGNQFFQQHWTWQYTQTVGDSNYYDFWPSDGRKEQSWTWMTHGVDNKLRVSQRSWYDTTGHRTIFSEYQYDALGRRLAVRTRRDSLCTATSTYRCLATTDRFIWDGDQLVAELRSPASTPDGQGGGSADFFGRVRYTHAGGIDEPIAVWEGGDAIVPHLSWRGQFEAGSNLISGDLLEGSEWIWPARYRDVNLAPEIRSPIPDPTRWLGSLINGQVDLNGLAYRRNRYYNPQTGRFTAEDPIGLAGGLNLYGYADGDPVNLSDPFGLTACCVHPGSIAVSIGKTVEENWLEIVTGMSDDDMFATALSSTPAGAGARAAGQLHHVISKSIGQAMKNAPRLRGVASELREQLVTRARTLMDHRGYQRWHREVDAQVRRFIERNPNVDKARFLRFLEERYAKPDLARRFPGGVKNP